MHRSMLGENDDKLTEKKKDRYLALRQLQHNNSKERNKQSSVSGKNQRCSEISSHRMTWFS